MIALSAKVSSGYEISLCGGLAIYSSFLRDGQSMATSLFIKAQRYFVKCPGSCILWKSLEKDQGLFNIEDENKLASIPTGCSPMNFLM